MKEDKEHGIKHVIREETLFASIRTTIKKRNELVPFIKELEENCKGIIKGSLTLIFHYDTPVDGFDAEIGFPVKEEINKGNIKTRTIRGIEFLSTIHHGKYSSLRESALKVYQFMYSKGLSADMEMVEKLLEYDLNNFEENDNAKTEIQASFLVWDKKYKKNLISILGIEKAEKIWEGGEKMNPFIPIEERIEWVKKTLDKLKESSTEDEQFEIISRLALTRPKEDINVYKQVYLDSGFDKLNEKIENAQKWVTQPKIDGNIIFTSKVPYRVEAYNKAESPDEKRKSYCWCALIRMADGLPDIDPIFCYRAAGWARQLFEGIFDKPVIKGKILKSVLKGDDYCEFELHMEDIPKT